MSHAHGGHGGGGGGKKKIAILISVRALFLALSETLRKSAQTERLRRIPDRHRARILLSHHGGHLSALGCRGTGGARSRLHGRRRRSAPRAIVSRGPLARQPASQTKRWRCGGRGGKTVAAPQGDE